MSLTPSTMLPLGATVPDFTLPDIYGGKISFSDFRDKKAVLVMFMCNHCPYVQHVRDEVIDLSKEYQHKDVVIIGINSNDFRTYPDDSPEKMREEAEKYGYTFPYLFDASQQVAKAFHAACTPDFFLFNRDRKLVYRGQLDDGRPGNGKPVTGADLRKALDAILEGKPATGIQKPSMGCNIKWKKGREPDYFDDN
jgi:peroxiredoxin